MNLYASNCIRPLTPLLPQRERQDLHGEASSSRSLSPRSRAEGAGEGNRHEAVQPPSMAMVAPVM